jgi:lysozyme
MNRLKKGAAATALAVALVGGFEGLRLYSYQDVVGVWTACYGETKGMGPGLRFTKAQCDSKLAESLAEHERGMRSCLTNPDSLPDKVYVADLSLAYNIGAGAFCRSSIARKTNAGDLRGACDAISLYNKAGGRTVLGLTNRRTKERLLCLEGLR